MESRESSSCTATGICIRFPSQSYQMRIKNLLTKRILFFLILNETESICPWSILIAFGMSSKSTLLYCYFMQNCNVSSYRTLEQNADFGPKFFFPSLDFDHFLILLYNQIVPNVSRKECMILVCSFVGETNNVNGVLIARCQLHFAAVIISTPVA